MKLEEIKSGTRAEIISYVRGKVTGIVKDVTNGAKSFGEVGERFSPLSYKDGELYELESSTIQQQIDGWVGSPIAIVSLAGNHGVGTYRERFMVTDYEDVRNALEVKRADNIELRENRIDAIVMLINMEMDSKERWDRILKIVDEFRGKTITL